MDFNRLTEKTQEAIQSAQSLAIERGHSQVVGEHLLYAICNQENGLGPRILQKLDIDPNQFIKVLASEMDKIPRFLARDMILRRFISLRVFPSFCVNRAVRKRLKDEYISVEHPFLEWFAPNHPQDYKGFLASLQLAKINCWPYSLIFEAIKLFAARIQRRPTKP